MKVRHLILAAALFMLGAFNAFAAERFIYEPNAFQAALEAGNPILVHVTAPWCGECQVQKPIVAALAQQSEYTKLMIFDVDFDTQKQALRQFRVQKQSTLIIFKGGAEVSRAVGITRRGTIEALMKKAF